MSSFSKRYFEDMKIEERLKPNKKGYKKVYTYIGDWYLYDLSKKELKKNKIIIGISSLVSLVIFIVCSLQHVGFNFTTFVAVPTIISVFLLFYELIGVLQFVFAKVKLMRVDFEDINKKIKIGSLGATILVLLTTIIAIIVMIITRTVGFFSILVIIGLLVSAALSGLTYITHKRLKFRTIENNNK